MTLIERLWAWIVSFFRRGHKAPPVTNMEIALE
jgi:hypothetical protein